MSGAQRGILASFDHLDATLEAIKALQKGKVGEITTFSPLPEHHIEHALGHGPSPVRVFTLVGGLTGAATGLAFTAWTAMDWPLIVGGKPILSVPAFIIIIFEMTILFGVLSTVIGLFINMRIPRLRPLVVYDPLFSAGRFGVYVKGSPEVVQEASRILQAAGASELQEDEEGTAHD
ncbi:MAG: DUF3341 domain-containing protein [Gemmatimonadota bacterium]